MMGLAMLKEAGWIASAPLCKKAFEVVVVIDCLLVLLLLSSSSFEGCVCAV